MSEAHEPAKTGGRALTRRYAEVVESRIRPGESHENGVAEKAHGLLKSALAQALPLWGSRDLASIEAYMQFVHQVVEKFRKGREALLAEERAALSPPATETGPRDTGRP